MARKQKLTPKQEAFVREYLIDLNATQLIGTVGAGKASRGLIRLRNGKIVTVRLGDKINGGQITQIGNGGLQYVKAGKQYALPILNGR